MRLKEHINDLEFRVYALETALRVLADAVGARALFTEEGFEEELRDEILAAQGEAHGAEGPVDPNELAAIVDDVMASVRELLAPDDGPG